MQKEGEESGGPEPNGNAKGTVLSQLEKDRLNVTGKEHAQEIKATKEGRKERNIKKGTRRTARELKAKEKKEKKLSKEKKRKEAMEKMKQKGKKNAKGQPKLTT